MRKRIRVLIISAAAVMVGVAQMPAQATTPTGGAAAHAVTDGARAHRERVSLSGWNLTIPVDSSGGATADARTVSPAELYSPWLTRDRDGALDFWAPANGARLGISLHARTELRGPGTFVLGQGSAGLKETTTVTQLPDHSHDIIIAQMFPTGTTPFAMLHYQAGKVYGYIHHQTAEYVLMSGIPLGATFEDSITADGDKVTFSVTYHGKTVAETATGISSWIGDTMHFQAGDYQQDVPGSAATDGARVSFSALCQYGVPGGADGPHCRSDWRRGWAGEDSEDD